jgi:predicted RNA-binding Zn ribbon-like protein
MTTTSPEELSIAPPPDDLALSFANTRYWRGSESPTEELNGFADVLAWCGRHCGLSPALLRLVQDRAGPHPRRAEHWFLAAIEMREVLARIFTAVAEGRTPTEDDLGSLEEALLSVPPRSGIVRRGESYAWALDKPRSDITALLAPVVWSAADLLMGKRLDRVRRCGNDRCLWLFLDDSKSGNRRWCFMSQCSGNRAKAHRHRLKRKDA